MIDAARQDLQDIQRQAKEAVDSATEVIDNSIDSFVEEHKETIENAKKEIQEMQGAPSEEPKQSPQWW